MRTLSLLILFLSIGVGGLRAQNLVPNPSFEDTISCPAFVDQIDKALGWSACRNSPDYFQTCYGFNGSIGVPNNLAGYQHAQHGGAYAGFISYSRNGIDYREHLICNLITPLQVNVKYNVSYFISLGNNYSGLATNNQGILFSTVNYSPVSWSPISNYCHITSNLIQTDTSSWVQVSGSFIADSTYSYLIIGNFYDDLNTDTIYVPPASHSYYYIDNINVEADTLSTIFEASDISPFKVFPNPVNSILQIESNSNLINEIEIRDVFGNLEIKKSINGVQKAVKINFGNIVPGSYFLKVNSNHKFYFYKIFKI